MKTKATAVLGSDRHSHTHISVTAAAGYLKVKVRCRSSYRDSSDDRFSLTSTYRVD